MNKKTVKNRCEKKVEKEKIADQKQEEPNVLETIDISVKKPSTAKKEKKPEPINKEDEIVKVNSEKLRGIKQTGEKIDLDKCSSKSL